MKQISARIVLVTCLVQELGCASGNPAPKTPPVSPGSVYELKVEQKFLDAGATITKVIVRNRDLERIESRTEFFGERARERLAAGGGQLDVSTTLYDFAAHKVYWSGFPGQNALPGGCSWGHYRSARAPVDEDLVTGTTDVLQKMSEGRQQRAAGAGVGNGVAAHILTFVGGNKPTAPEAAAVWPVRVFLADEGGTLLKAEAEGTNGKPTTLFEVTQLTFGAPTGVSLVPPKGCTFGNAEMDDSGAIRAHAETTVRLEASGSLDAASGSSSSAVNVTSSGGQ